MKKIRFYWDFCKKPSFILLLILIAFFLKGVFLAAAFPIFDGQDEARHYNTIQFFSEPKEKTWKINIATPQQMQARDSNNLETYNFSEEIKKTATAADNSALRTEIYNTIDFSNSYDGKNEAQINSKIWQPINQDYPPDITAKSYDKLYHILGTFIENTFARDSILVRFYLIRIFSVLLSALTVLCAYLIMREIGFQPKASLIMTAIIAFQPKFSFFTTNISYAPLLILLFTTFTLGGILYLKNGLDWRNAALMITSAVLGMFTKATAIVLVAMLIFMVAFMIYQKFSRRSKRAKYWSGPLFILASILVLVFFHQYLPLNNSKGISGIIVSLYEYLAKTLTIGRLGLSARTYWGTLSWVNSWTLDNIINLIWLIEAFAIAGLAIFLFSKKKFDFLPEKKYIIFLISMIIALQLGIRLADWPHFAKTGSLALGTPGRYFLPNLASHIILVFTGLGALFAYFKKEKYFEIALKAGLVLMFAFCTYMIFDVVIYRFYL